MEERSLGKFFHSLHVLPDSSGLEHASKIHLFGEEDRSWIEDGSEDLTALKSEDAETPNKEEKVSQDFLSLLPTIANRVQIISQSMNDEIKS